MIQSISKAPRSGPTIPFRRKAQSSASQMAVMVFTGEYDIAAAPRLRADLKRVRDIQRVVLDFTDVTFVDSKAIHELINLRNYRAAKGFEREAIVFANPNLRRLFGILMLEQVFHCVSNLSDVVRYDDRNSHLYYASSGNEHHEC
ncbi:MAG: STAS domain-containing protein [Candidatus Cybelea sp.]